MRRKQQHKWEQQPVEMASSKTMGIIGYGAIGAACARIAKQGLKMKVLGLKRDPTTISEEYKSYVDELLGFDDMDRL